MAKNKRVTGLDHPLRYVEEHLKRKHMRALPGRNHPREEPVFPIGGDRFTTTPQTEVITATLTSHNIIYQSGLWHQDDEDNLPAIRADAGVDGGDCLRVIDEKNGLHKDFVATMMPNDLGRMDVWVSGFDGGSGSGEDYEYILSIHDFNEDTTPVDEESLVIRWELASEELRLYPDLTDYPDTYSFIEIPEATWQEEDWHLITATWSYQDQEWIIYWDGVAGELETPGTPDIVPWPEWDVFTKAEIFTDSNYENYAYHDVQFLTFRPLWTLEGSECAGIDKQVIFNDGGVCAGDDGLIYDKTNNQLGIAGAPSGAANEKLDVHGDSIIEGYLKVTGDYLSIGGNSKELRFQNAGNYVGFEAPAALGGNQIWVLPAADGAANEVIETDGAGNLTWADLTDDFPRRIEWNQNGFATLATSTLTWTDAGPNRTLSIQPTGANFDYWMTGEVYTTTGDTRQITNVEGVHVIYYDGVNLTSTANPTVSQLDTIIRTKCLVSIVYWDTSAVTAIYVGEERHRKSMAPETHSYLHFIEGLRWVSGLGLNTINADGAGLTADAQFGVDTGAVADEDLAIAPAAVLSTTGLPIYYMTGAAADWNKDVNAGFSVRTFDDTAADRLAWNEFTGGAWQLTEAGNNDFVLCHVFATTEKDLPMIAVMGQAVYPTKKQAREGALTEITSLVFNDILFPEIRAIATVIFQTNLAYASAVNARIVSTDEGDDYVDWRNEVVSRTTVSTTDHGSLTGLGDDDHTIYSLVDGTRAFTGNVSLDNGVELRLWDVGSSHYVGFEAPALTANQIWVLPDADGAQGEVMDTDGAGTLDWHPNIRVLYPFGREEIVPTAVEDGLYVPGPVVTNRGATDAATVGYVVIRAGKITGVSMTQSTDMLVGPPADSYVIYVYVNNALATSWGVSNGVNEYEYVDDTLTYAVSQGDEISVVVSDIGLPQSINSLSNVIVTVEVTEGI